MDGSPRTVGLPVPAKENETRRALLPRNLAELERPDHVLIEKGYGVPLGIKDAEYCHAGARVVSREEACACPIVCVPRPIPDDPYFGAGKTLFGWIHAVQGRAITDRLLSHNMTAIAWEEMYENGRHVFWRNNELAGEAAMHHVALLCGRSLYDAHVALIGRGHVARGVLRVLDRTCSRLTVYNRETVTQLREQINDYDIVINAVRWDVFREDHLVYEADLGRMKPGSMLIDLSCDEAMGVESSRPTTLNNPVYLHHGVLHYAVDHTPSLLFRSATESISEQLIRFLPALIEGVDNVVLRDATIISEGVILDERISRFQGRGASLGTS